MQPADQHTTQSCDKPGNQPTQTLASGHNIRLAKKTVFILETSAKVSTFLASLSEASL